MLGIVLALPLLMTFWWTLLSHNLARGEALFARFPQQQVRNRLALGTDFLEYRDYYRNFPVRFSEMTVHNSIVEYYKRPLYGPISATLSVVAHSLFRLRYPNSMFAVLSFYASVATVLLFALMRRLGLPLPEASLLTGIGALSFSWLSVFSLPESYSLSVIAALAAAVSGSRLPSLDSPAAARSVLRHASIVVLASWIYVPVSGAVLLIASAFTARRQWLSVMLPLAAGTGLLVLSPQFLPLIGESQLQVEYLSRWTSLNHFREPAVWVSVSGGLFFFGLVSPVNDFLTAAPTLNWAAALSRSGALAGAVGLALTYLWLAFQVVIRNAGRFEVGALLWLGSFYLFHVWYNPGELLLYMSVPLVVSLYVAGETLTNVYRSERTVAVRVRAALIILLALVAPFNVMTAVGR